MKISIALLVGVAFATATAQAQIMVAQPQPAQAVQQEQIAQPAEPVQSVQPAQLAVSPTPQLQVAEVDEQAAALRKSQNENKKLREENSRLLGENASLNDRIGEFTRLGGSEVRAYCPAATTSRNTAGAEANCRDLGGYTCEPVSGLCHTSCQVSDMCAPGWTCDTGIQQCVKTGSD